MTRRHGFSFAFLSYFMFSVNSPIARQAFLDGMEPNTLLAYRFCAGAILFLITIGVTNLAKATGDERPMDRRGVLISLVSGLINGAAIYFYFNSLDLMPASFVSVLGIGCYIVIVMALLTVFGEKFTPIRGLRLLLGISGIWLLIGPSGELGSKGVLFVVVGALLFAFHMISLQWYLSEYNTWAVATLVVSATATLLTAVWLITGLNTGGLNFAIPSFWSWVAVIVLALFSSWIGRFFSYRAVAILGSGEIALMTPLETLLAITWSVLFLGEWLLPVQWLGAFLIILGVGLVGLKWVYTNFFDKKASVAVQKID